MNPHPVPLNISQNPADRALATRYAPILRFDPASRFYHWQQVIRSGVDAICGDAPELLLF
ncbi:MAG TPA: hypothetical protein PLJ78_02260 [Anaerolineae bacterium]|nr:hypothetical protein [Anaerolineae bacterium]HQK12748.1 hypothetical protein [Anaerolineae bacterium]